MVNWQSFVVIFLATIGTITVLTTHLWNRVITGELRGAVSGYEFSSPVFAFIGSFITVYLIAKGFTGKTFGMQEALMAFLAGVLVIMVYTFAPQYLPPSFAILAP